MVSNRARRWVVGSTFLLTMAIPAIAFAEEAGGAAGVETWQTVSAKAIAAGLAMGLAAVGAGYAQGHIGAAGAGAIAERPDVAIWVITLQALPEIIVLLGFVSAILITG